MNVKGSICNICHYNSQNGEAFCDQLGIPRYGCNVSVVECPEPPRVRNAEKTSRDHNYLAVVTYNCTGGMRFEDGHTSKSIKCIDPGVWSDSVQDCASTCNTSIL